MTTGKKKTLNNQETLGVHDGGCNLCGMVVGNFKVQENKSVFFFISSAVGQPVRVHAQFEAEMHLIADQFEVSECTLPGPSVGDITEDGVVASCHTPLAWDTNGREVGVTTTIFAI